MEKAVDTLAKMCVVPAPASKSHSHRALLAAALAGSPSTLNGLSRCDDVRITQEVLQSLGICMQEELGAWRIDPSGLCTQPHNVNDVQDVQDVQDVYFAESGSSCRMLVPVLAALAVPCHCRAAPGLEKRPMAPLCQTLEALGIALTYHAGLFSLPFTLSYPHGSLGGGNVQVDTSLSSQIFSGMLFAATRASASLTLHTSGRIVSRPYIALTLQVLHDFGARLDARIRACSSASFDPQNPENSPWKIIDAHALSRFSPQDTTDMELMVRVRPSILKGLANYPIEGDWSGAAPLLAAGLLGNTPVCVTGLSPASLQADTAFLALARAMGGHLETTGSTITAFPSALHSLDCNMADCPDLVPLMAMLAATAEGQSHLRGIAHARLKESNRLACTLEELARLGIQGFETEDGLVLQGKAWSACPKTQPPLAGQSMAFSCHNDHRLAMTLALTETLGLSLQLDTPAVVSKSFPDFWQHWALLRAQN